MRHASQVPTVVMLLLACAGERREAAEGEGRADSARMGMAMQMTSLERLSAERAYLDSVARAGPAEVAAMVAGQGARMEQMLSAMDQDMKAMNMSADAAWQALVDSVRADLAAILGLEGEPLVLRIRAHAGRMRRILERHQAMMKM